MHKISLALNSHGSFQTESVPNTACTGRLGLCAFLVSGSELWQISVFKPSSLPAAGNANRWAVSRVKLVRQIGIIAMKHSRTQYLAFLSFVILLSACAPAPVQVLPTRINTATVEATSTVKANITPTQTATIIPTATAVLTCPNVNPNTQFNLPKDSSQLEAVFLDYLNEGGDPAKIEVIAETEKVQPFTTLSADIDGDSLPEIVTITRDLFEDPATIRIFHCEQNDYQLAKSISPDGMGFGRPLFATKIFDSEPPYMIVQAGEVSGWGQKFIAIGRHNSEWQIINLAEGTTPSEIALSDLDKDGIKEIFLETRTASTPGGGVSRVIVDSYAWNGKEFTYKDSTMPPGTDRVHYIDDAETAWKQGNPLLAISYYEIAARDPNLTSYSTTYEFVNKQTQLAKPYQQAFAFFRIVAIWYYLDRPDMAAQYLKEMSEAFPKGKPGYEFVLAAQIMSGNYEKEGDFTKSCGQAEYVFQSQYPDVIANHLGDWGVANPMYSSIDDICKFG